MRFSRIFLVLIFCAPCTAAVAVQPLRVAVSASWGMPIAKIERENTTQGIVHDLYAELGRALGRPVTYVVLPRKRLDAAVLAGDIDLRCYTNPQWTDIADRLRWSKPLFEIANVVIARADVAQPANIDGLPEKAPVSTVLGYSYAVLEDYFRRGRLLRDESSDEEKLMLKVTAGRTSYGIALDLAVDWYRKTTPRHVLADWTLPVSRTEMYCAVPLQGRVDADSIFSALEQLRKRGRIEAILKAYR